MTSDKDDRTVFRQPTPGGGDRTVMRPRPGGARGGQRAVPQHASGSVPRHQQAPLMDEQSAQFSTGKGLNPLVNLASTLIAVFAKTRSSMTHSDAAGLHQRLTNEIRTFESRARETGARQEVVLSARYVLCSALDEAVLNTPWGSESAWAQRTLLSIFHNETSGGEKFFQILDRMRQSPAENMDMLELFYVLLSLGFEGKYRLMSRGRDALEQIRDELFSTIRRYRGEYERELAGSWHGLGKVNKTLANIVPMWVVLVVVVALLFFGYSGVRYWLYENTTPLVEQLETISTIEQEADSK
ncbi:type VI secretion system protein ImpK [Alteromonadaceae bacterium Bs31]|nr:type VI secretion system protein ImpK [Alteromonadaceae bacterium Bs31]